MKRRVRAVIAALIFFSVSCGAETIFQEGDIIFQTSKSAQSKAIRLATKSKYSHMGILFMKDGALCVLEAVEPVKYTPLSEWLERGEGGHYAVMRLAGAGGAINENSIKKLRQTGEGFLGRHYDPYFEWSDERIYCSELVWKIYQRALGIEIGSLAPLGSFDLSSREVQAKIKERYGNKLPLKEKAISPAAMFASPKLVKVVEK